MRRVCQGLYSTLLYSTLLYSTLLIPNTGTNLKRNTLIWSIQCKLEPPLVSMVANFFVVSDPETPNEISIDLKKNECKIESRKTEFSSSSSHVSCLAGYRGSMWALPVCN